MIRKTNQRSIIAEVIEASGNPLAVAQILVEAQKRHPTLGIATVYRTLKSLLEAGTVKAVEWPGEAPRYERADKRHHHHFHCRACGEVFDVEGCVPGIAALVPAGFSLENHEIFLSGTCAHCKEATL